jgi:hypothetical protein
VPFGTGPVVSRLSTGKDALLSYDPGPFSMLKAFFAGIGKKDIHRNHGSANQKDPYPQALQSFLESQDFTGALDEIRANSASEAAFRKRFWRWFNMFRIMKFLHYAREHGYPDVPVGEAAAELLRRIDPEGKGIPSVGTDPKKLLLIYRMLEMR